MSYHRSSDDEFFEGVMSIVGGVLGLVAGLFAAVGFGFWQGARQLSSGMPESLENWEAAKYVQPEHPLASLLEEHFSRDDLVRAGIVFVLLGLFCLFLTSLWLLGLLLIGLAWGCFQTSQHVNQEVNASPALPTSKFQMRASPLHYVITLPRESAWDTETARRFIDHLLRTTVHLALRIVAEPHEIRWEILDWRTNLIPDHVVRAVRSYYPQAEIEQRTTQPPPEGRYPFYRYNLFFKQVEAFVWPLKPVQELRQFDPLTAIVQAMSGLREGERMVYTLALSLPAQYAHQVGEKLITVDRITPGHFFSSEGVKEAVSSAVTRQTRVEKYRESDQRVAQHKLNQTLYQCFLAVEIDSPDPQRVHQLAGIDSQVWEYVNEPYNALAWDDSRPLPESIRQVKNPEEDRQSGVLGTIYRWAQGRSAGWQRSLLILSPDEIAGLWHLPHTGFKAREIEWLHGRNVAAPKAVRQAVAGAVIGVNSHAGETVEVRLPDSERTLHTYIVGKTGVGKSTLAHHIIHQDIAAGKGVGVIDPHGDLVRRILRTSIPPEREDDVVLVDFAQTDYPPPLNPFSVPAGVSRETVLAHIMGVLKKIYADDWSKTRMENVLYSALVALLYEENATPRDISRLMTDAEYRTKLLQDVQDPVAQEYWWDEYEQFSEALQLQVREPVLNRIRIFYRNPAVRHMVCHPHHLDFRAIMDEGKIFLANLNSDETRSEQANLGAMLMANFQMAAMGRQSGDGETPRPFYLFVEEVQQFVTSSLPDVFSEARKFGLGLTAVNQYLGQLRGSTLEAILGNVGATILFACGPDDARALAGYLKPNLTADDLVNFDRFKAAVKMQVEGKTVPSFSIATQPPLPEPPDADAREARIREKSITNYTPWSREEVAGWLSERYARKRPQHPQGTVTDFD